MELSPQDIKGMWSGMPIMILTLFVFNVAALFFNIDTWHYVTMTNQTTGLFVGLFFYAMVISIFYTVLSVIGVNMYSLLKHCAIVNPFR
ncbi:MAG: hypothetical protein GF401_04170 [Chitinivibrionales bacterium]|nr:hypothetical protein [Chitinivibrionales bacterium]